MQCNIDAKGRAVRLVWGGMLVLCSLLLGVLAVVGVLVGWWVWALAGVLLVGGAFAVFEARKGWCLLRAMGIRTPM